MRTVEEGFDGSQVREAHCPVVRVRRARQRMTLEPDLLDAKRALAEAQTIVIATPL